MRDGNQLEALARRLDLARRAVGDERLDAAAGERQLNARLLVDALRHILGHRAAPALRLCAFLPRRVEAAIGLSDAVGALLQKLEIERSAILADRGVHRLHRRTVRRRDADRVDLHRAVIREEQVVRHRAIDRDPRIVARDDRRRGQDPRAVRVRRADHQRGDGGGNDQSFRQGLHDLSPGMVWITW